MSIATEITRLQGAKADLKTAIEGKGVTVPAAALLDDYADLVDAIQTGGGGYTAEEILTGAAPSGAVTLSPTVNIPSRAISGRSALTELTINYPSNIATTNQYVITDNSALQKVIINGSSLTFGAYYISSNPVLTEVRISNVITLNPNAIRQNATLALVDAGTVTSIGGTCFFNNSLMKTLILRSTSICSLNTSAFQNTPFYSGGSGGTIYIPESLYDHLGDGTALDYKADANWSTIDGYGTITWAKIEGSIYE